MLDNVIVVVLTSKAVSVDSQRWDEVVCALRGKMMLLIIKNSFENVLSSADSLFHTN